MRYIVIITIISLVLVSISEANSYMDNDPINDEELNYSEPGNYLDEIQPAAEKRSPSIYVYRRSCIRRSGNCDHRPNGCCHNSSCRCNLWGSNCRCQRMGLFQKWG
ncbi:unnamed protein product [Diamesa hyperborea]